MSSKRIMKTSLLTTLAIFALATSAALAAAKDSRCYELRVYYAPPGKLDDLNARFRNHTLKLFEKHGISNVGYWMPVENPENKLVYLLAFPSRDAARQSWKAFFADPEWQAVVKTTEANGKLVAKVESTFLAATDFSPAIAPSTASEPRAFELRTYTAAPGRRDALLARFRDHTLTLFTKYGMTNFGYWTPLDQDKGADNTLIYLLAHKSREAADASFKAFREDPAWVAARKASEEKAGGSLTTKVESVFLKATDYSPAK